jgi:catechol 2,3-dioxygenase-like lactoylglutathione lyase family enzyme
MIDHVALLVRSVERAAEALKRLGVGSIGAKDAFPGEGTAEIYVGDPERGARLLLMEAIGPGPYRRALAKRGPGLHHLALVAGDVQAAVARGTAAGWVLKKPGAVSWLARPGAPLLELLPSGASAAPLVTALAAPMAPNVGPWLAELGFRFDIRQAAPADASITLDGRRVPFGELV